MNKAIIAVAVGVVVGAVGVGRSETLPLTAFSGMNTSAAKQVEQMNPRASGYTIRSRVRTRNLRNVQSVNAGEIQGSAGQHSAPNTFQEDVRSEWLRRFLRDIGVRN